MTPLIQGKTTRLREPIPADIKLGITLRYLATGESFQSLMYQYRVHQTTISQFIPKVCDAIYEVLKEDFLSMPDTKEKWMELAQGAEEKWQFPNAFAAADGKHISKYCPNNTKSEFFNYKGFYSVVLLALIDYDYKFVYVDVGCQGRISDGGVFRNSSLKTALADGTLNLPEPRVLPKPPNGHWDPIASNEPMPYVFVGDNAFPLSEHCLKPYPGRNLTEKQIFGYRLSRFRRVSENGFGILTSIFRIFSTKINLCPDKAIKIILAAIVLHNFLRTMSRNSYTPTSFVDHVKDGNLVEGQWRDQAAPTIFKSMPPQRSGNNRRKRAEEIRDKFADHFCGAGQVPWQWKCLI